MKCAVFKEPYNFEIVNRDIPLAGKGQVLVKIMAAGICGSDISPYTGRDIQRRQPGIIMGHEAAGIVESVGEGVTAWKKGDRVAVNPQIYCEKCIYCRTGAYNLCDNMFLIGSSKRVFLDGAMCQYLCISDKQLLSLPGNVGYNEGAMLDPAGNAFRVVRCGGVGVGDTVAVMGCGAIGLIAIQTARIAGAGKVIAVSRSDRKLGIAGEVGADVCINSGDAASAERRIKSLTNGKGADVIIDAAGFADTYALAVKSCKKGGAVVALGYGSTHINFPLTELIFKEIRLIGSTGFAAEGEMVLEYLSKGLIKLDKIITGRFPLEDIKKGFDKLIEPGGSEIKVIINPN
ncbi:L-iditol 2-dehydrogenase [Anaerobacterium chartisolvens]|uniref:L-iditol 2-dehydrogenase n=1 Tax=Anaerobacterium chartisolvens TaxID=1297424 RepID=A0A369AHM8_9FIRM|nr:alcohol dehydrogenase catalytic domain-containing protein [Anaerobacterium chartisolvens]RCX08671.1 L-iditol 2-dehydrogenase [Anaerobacterium chartisolvens]